jgi:hypothetical protein
MSKSVERRSKGQAKGRMRSAQKRPDGQPSWDDLETSLRGLRNLNAMQLELIANVEQIGKQLRRKRV